eukprot:NODE_321_length_2412_cov_14.320788_g299_i0.p1 GENE.NODE_321_length_2412_cov_14.320788_g299_i0~~NODE_321_length_2412_cov_14.320788_g299_i0.p1  ORF type:complete len:781 (-),score=181.16 NODE_321_length_2412_cov_14.320788_g299_i0:18-2360(-)
MRRTKKASPRRLLTKRPPSRSLEILSNGSPAIFVPPSPVRPKSGSGLNNSLEVLTPDMCIVRGPLVPSDLFTPSHLTRCHLTYPTPSHGLICGALFRFECPSEHMHPDPPFDKPRKAATAPSRRIFLTDAVPPKSSPNTSRETLAERKLRGFDEAKEFCCDMGWNDPIANQVHVETTGSEEDTHNDSDASGPDSEDLVEFERDSLREDPKPLYCSTPRLTQRDIDRIQDSETIDFLARHGSILAKYTRLERSHSSLSLRASVSKDKTFLTGLGTPMRLADRPASTLSSSTQGLSSSPPTLERVDWHRAPGTPSRSQSSPLCQDEQRASISSVQFSVHGQEESQKESELFNQQDEHRASISSVQLSVQEQHEQQQEEPDLFIPQEQHEQQQEEPDLFIPQEQHEQQQEEPDLFIPQEQDEHQERDIFIPQEQHEQQQEEPDLFIPQEQHEQQQEEPDLFIPQQPDNVNQEYDLQDPDEASLEYDQQRHAVFDDQDQSEQECDAQRHVVFEDQDQSEQECDAQDQDQSEQECDAQTTEEGFSPQEPELLAASDEQSHPLPPKSFFPKKPLAHKKVSMKKRQQGKPKPVETTSQYKLSPAEERRVAALLSTEADPEPYACLDPNVADQLSAIDAQLRRLRPEVDWSTLMTPAPETVRRRRKDEAEVSKRQADAYLVEARLERSRKQRLGEICERLTTLYEEDCSPDQAPPTPDVLTKLLTEAKAEQQSSGHLLPPSDPPSDMEEDDGLTQRILAARQRHEAKLSSQFEVEQFLQNPFDDTQCT